MNNFKRFKDLVQKRSGGISTAFLAVALAAAVPTSIFAYSASDVTRVTDEIGETDESLTGSKSMSTNNNVKDTAEVVEVPSAYQISPIGTQDPLNTSFNNVLDSMNRQLESVKIAASKAEQESTLNEENTKSESNSNADTYKDSNLDSVYLNGDVVYKPSTHYVHRKDCRWADDTCYSISNAGSLEALIVDIDSMLNISNSEDVQYYICTDCNPILASDSNKVVLENQVASTDTKESGTTIDTSTKLDYYTESYGDVYDWSGLDSASLYYDYEGAASNAGISDYDIILLRKIVSSEYGSSWVPIEEKAKIVASVMNMVKSDDPWYPDTIEEVLEKACEPWGFDRYKDYYIDDSIIMAVDYYFAYPEEFGTYKSWWGDGTWNYFHNE